MKHIKDDVKLELKVICFDGKEKNFILISPSKSLHTKGYAMDILRVLSRYEGIGGIENIKEVHCDNFLLRRKNSDENFKYFPFVGYIKSKRIIV